MDRHYVASEGLPGDEGGEERQDHEVALLNEVRVGIIALNQAMG